MSADNSAAAAAAAAAAPEADVKVVEVHAHATPQKLHPGGAAARRGQMTPSTPGLARRAPEGTPGQSATLKRALDAQEWTAELAVDLSKWVVEILGDKSVMRGVTTADEFFARLQTGVELCDLINAIAPEYDLPVTRDAKPKSFQSFDNLEHFLKAAKKIGVNAVSLFEVDDLSERKNDKLVVNTMLQLSDCAHEQFDAPRVHLRDELRAAFGSPAKAKKGLSTPAPAPARNPGSASYAATQGVAAGSAAIGSAHKRGASRIGTTSARATTAGGALSSSVFGEGDDDADADADAAARRRGGAGADGADGRGGDGESDSEWDDDFDSDDDDVDFADDGKDGDGNGNGEADGDAEDRKRRTNADGDAASASGAGAGAGADGDKDGSNSKGECQKKCRRSGGDGTCGGRRAGAGAGAGKCGGRKGGKCKGKRALPEDTKDAFKVSIALALAATHTFLVFLKRRSTN